MTLDLDELYLDNLGGGGVPDAGLGVGIARDFGSVARWRDAFFAMAAHRRDDGSGWAVLCWSNPRSRLVNHWGDDAAPWPSGATPLLALRAPDCTEAFMDRIDWNVVADRHTRAVASSAQGLAIAAAQVRAARCVVLDVRRRASHERARTQIAGASWRDPERVDEWGAALAGEAGGADVVVYCVHGHEVGQATALRLRVLGIPARYLAGGIEAWETAGLPMLPKGAAS